MSNLAYAHPGGDLLFSEVSFKITPGRHVGVVGANGVGKSTLFRVLAGMLPADDGDVDIGPFAYMAQDVGVGADSGRTVRELLLEAAPARLRLTGERMIAAERAAGRRRGPGGRRDAAGRGDRRVVRARRLRAGGALGRGLPQDRPRRPRRRRRAPDDASCRAASASGWCSRCCFASDASVLLLDEPDNFLDVPAKLELERRIAASRKTIVLISHDRDLLGAATNAILTLEANGTWTHGDSYRTYPEAREQRQQLLGDRLDQWKREERRLFQFYKMMKQRAAISDVNAKRADAAETRWKRFVDVGPPPAPVKDQQIQVRIPGGDSARIVVRLRDIAIDGLVRPFEDEIHFGERVGLIGPNGSGKTHLIRLLAGEEIPHDGELRLGNRVSAGLFTQLNSRADLEGRVVLDVVMERLGALEPSMRALARYRIQEAANRSTDTLSGGQKARLEILCLELEGHNLLLLDEPTDNLDIDSSEALEAALESFVGTVVAVSHDRAFLRRLDRFLLLAHDGAVYALPDTESALEALSAPAEVAGARLAKRLTAGRR